MQIIGLQLDSVWENKAANHDKVLALLDRARPSAGALVVLSEMFATGFSMNVAAIHDESRETQDFLSRAAAERKIYLMGGVVMKDDATGRGRNESVVYSPEGKEVARYCKLQPFTLGGESEHYVAGGRTVLFECQEFMIAPFICYDLRFPELFRRAAAQGANLITVIASWPAMRDDHWVTLLKARAIENQAYVVGVNRCGRDPKHYHSGRSIIYDPHGRVLADAGSEEGWIEAQLELQPLLDWRRDFPALGDMRRDFNREGD
ncbi:MAG TPA: nitrilase-related carbon-nitrogen hydrolase [Blastocatellia bacterium]|nr:nitrilase-related carbon-nitrogen hydrolase [Blastocatellia bacterium]